MHRELCIITTLLLIVFVHSYLYGSIAKHQTHTCTRHFTPSWLRPHHHVSKKFLTVKKKGFSIYNKGQNDVHDDSCSHEYVHSPTWKYWYRPRGMRTSTDDILVAFFATIGDWSQSIYPSRNGDEISDEKGRIIVDIDQIIGDNRSRLEPMKVNHYVDLGCGIGSTLFLVTHILQPSPTLSLGVEVQNISAKLAQRTIADLPIDAPSIRVIHTDLRTILSKKAANSRGEEEAEEGPTDCTLFAPFPNTHPVAVQYSEFGTSADNNFDFSQIRGQCQLFTANPPYMPLTDGRLPRDHQRLNARFECHGSIYDYAQVAYELLSNDPQDDARFVFSFWSSAHDRVMLALQKQRNCHFESVKAIKVRCGRQNTVNEEYLTIYEARKFRSSKIECSHDNAEYVLDLRRDPETKRLNPQYYAIQAYLKMNPRPLSKPSIFKQINQS